MPLSLNKTPIPDAAGIGLRAQHYQQVISDKPDIPWLEVHTENFFAEGGISLHILDQVRAVYPMSFHGVGMSLGSADKLSETHLAKTKRLVDRFEPTLVSEHISWSTVDGVFLNDLLPVPYTKNAMQSLVNNIDQMQEYLGRQILVENPSTYLEFSKSEMSESEFINEVIKQSGCGLLLDINNIYVSSQNNAYNAIDYIKNINHEAVREIHLAGYSMRDIDGKKLLIDTHGAPVYPDVWELYKKAVATTGKRPTLIEWDTDIPELDVLMNEAKKAQEILDNDS